MNQIIFEVGSQFNVPVVDIYNLIRRIHKSGIRVGGIHLDTRYITGGFFSLDGIHPTPTGYALIANEFIKAVNAFYSADIPLVDVSAALFASRRKQ
ncbi:MAG: SGNH/GDSL hydrolase family protein [candidate division KSB1 bacterium]|nr:SGNH/GDSL hydrolase family protein [candidate division KSB1 bacterium]